MGHAEVYLKGTSIHTKCHVTLKDAPFNEPLYMPVRNSFAYGVTGVACDSAGDASDMDNI